MTALPDDILREARRLIGYDDNLRSELMEQRAQRIAYALHATYLRAQKETAEACVEIASEHANNYQGTRDYEEAVQQVAADGCAIKISAAISRHFLEGQKDERG